MMRESERGVTLLEVAVAGAVLAIVLLIAMLAVVESQSLAQRDQALAEVDGSGKAAALHIAERLRQSGTDPVAGMTLSTPAGGGGFHRIRFKMATGLDKNAAQVVWSGGTREVGFALDPSEGAGGAALNVNGVLAARIGATANGADDDGDGLVDEGVLYYMTQDAADADVYMILARNVLPATNFRLATNAAATTPPATGDVVQIHIETARRDPGARTGGTIITRPENFIRAVVDVRATPRNLAD